MTIRPRLWWGALTSHGFYLPFSKVLGESRWPTNRWSNSLSIVSFILTSAREMLNWKSFLRWVYFIVFSFLLHFLFIVFVFRSFNLFSQWELQGPQYFWTLWIEDMSFIFRDCITFTKHFLLVVVMWTNKLGFFHFLVVEYATFLVLEGCVTKHVQCIAIGDWLQLYEQMSFTVIQPLDNSFGQHTALFWKAFDLSLNNLC